MKQLKYWGEFSATDGTLYRAEIALEAEAAIMPEEIFFSDNPIEIEWAEGDKIEPICSSSCTLTIESDLDRRFVDLYTVKAGSVWLELLRNGESYWTGSLDPELYEEPYSEKSHYNLSLTFSDFAYLDRVKWSRIGFIKPIEIVNCALELAGLNLHPLIEMVSTKLSSSAADTILRDVELLCDNFWDEDDEAMSVREVLESVLKPFALRLIQKGGVIYLYDLHSLYSTVPTPVIWDGTDATLGVDKSYNNIEVNFSPYEKLELLKGRVDSDLVKLGDSYSVDVPGESAPGFDIRLSMTGGGNILPNLNRRFFKVKSTFSGSDCAGVAFSYKRGEVQLLQHPTASIGDELFRVTDSCYIANVSSENRANYRLRLSMDLLVDVRINPFEQDSLSNEEGNWKRFKNWANFAWVPFILTLRDEDGRAIAHFNNKMLRNSTHYRTGSAIERWDAGEGAWGDAYMAWYNESNRESDTGLGGWSSNRKMIGEYKSKLPSLFEKLGDGYLIDLPSRFNNGIAGWLELKIGTGIEIIDHGGSVDSSIWSRIRWVLYKDVDLKLVDAWGKEVEKVDCIYKAWVNKDAREELLIDTIVGTVPEARPSALGQLFQSSDKAVLRQLYRAGKTDSLENLLIGTVYSNYARRSTLLSGTIELLPSFGILSDNNTSGKFILLSERQRLDKCESEITMVQLNEDNYNGIEWAI